MAHVTGTDLDDLQFDALATSTAANTQMPASPLASKNKAFKTLNKTAVGAVNEVFASTTQTATAFTAFTNKYNTVLGDSDATPALLTDLQKIDANVLLAVVAVYKSVHGPDLDNPVAIPGDIATILLDLQSSEHTHSNKTALDAVSGVNTGDQDLSGLALVVHQHVIADIDGLVAALAAKEATIAAGTSTQVWRGDKTWVTLGTDIVPEGTTNKYFTDARVAAYIAANNNAANKVVVAGPDGKIPSSLLAAGGGLVNKGTWNAATNTPTLAATPPADSSGWFYIVSNTGDQFGNTWNSGDWIISDGSAWQHIDNVNNPNAVTSVFGRLGPTITAQAADYASFYVALSGSYANPTWITSLASSKISGVLGTDQLGTGAADNTKYLRGDGTWATIPLTGGTVTSVDLVLPAEFSVTGSPVTTSGTLTAAWAQQAAGFVLAAPTSAAGTPSFRALAASDIPSLDAAKIATGVFTAAHIPGLDASKIISGVFGPAFLGTGTRDGTKFLRDDGVWTVVVSSGGTVTSVGLSAPAEFNVIGTPVTASGNLTLAWASVGTQGYVLASPANSSGTPSFRALTATDIPVLDASKVTTGVFSTARLGTGTPTASTFLRGDGTWYVLNLTSGTVSSVALAMPVEFTVSNSPITTSDTFTVTWANQTGNTFFAGPAASPSGAPSFRALVVDDIPALDAAKITTGTFNALRIPDLDASKIVSGVLSPGRVGSGTRDGSRFLRDDGVWTSIALNNGTVTNVALATPVDFVVTGSPVTTTGTLTFAWAPTAAGNLVMAAPDGTSGTPGFRSLVSADIPSLPASKISSGVLGTARLGTGTADSSTYLRGDGTWAAVSVSAVTSVGLAAPAEFVVSNSPVTSVGNLTLAWATVNTAGLVFASPSATSGTPGFRALLASDIPGLDAAKITTGVFDTGLIPGLDAAKIISGVFSPAQLGSGSRDGTKYLRDDGVWSTISGIGLAEEIAGMITQTKPYSLMYGQQLTLGVTATPVVRTVTISSAIVYAGVDAIQLVAINSSNPAQQLTRVAHTAGVYTFVNQTQLDVANYDNGTDVVALGANRYGVRWVYRTVGDDAQAFYALGGEYTNVSSAQAAPLPTGLPIVVQNHAMLVGRIIVQAGVDTPVQIDQVVSTSFAASTANAHNSLDGLQGTGPDYYHLNATQFANASNGPWLPLTAGAGNQLTGMLFGPSVTLSNFAVLRDRVGNPAYGAIYPTGVTPATTNYALAFTDSGTDTYLAATDTVTLVVSGTSKLTASSDAVNLGSGVALKFNGTTVIDSFRNANVNSLTATTLSGTGNRPVVAKPAGNLETQDAAAFRTTIGAAASTDLAGYLPLTAGIDKPLTGTLYGTNIKQSGYLLNEQTSSSQLTQLLANGGQLQLLGNGGRASLVVAGQVTADTAGAAPYVYFAGTPTGVGSTGGGMMFQFNSTNGVDVWSWNNTAWVKKSQINSAGMIAVVGGTAAGFLKANGTIDTTGYLTSINPTYTGRLTGPEQYLENDGQILLAIRRPGGNSGRIHGIAFQAQTLNGTWAEFGRVMTYISSVADGAQTGGMRLYAYDAGTIVQALDAGPTGVTFGGTLSGPRATLTEFGTMAAMPGDSNYAALHATGVTRTASNYALRLADSGADTMVNAATTVVLEIAGAAKLGVTSSNVNLGSGVSLSFNATTVIDASRNATFASVTTGTLTLPDFGKLTALVGDSNYAAIYGTGVTPSSSNYVLRFADDGGSTVLNAAVFTELTISGTTKVRIDTSDLRLASGVGIRMDAITVIDSGRNGSFVGLVATGNPVFGTGTASASVSINGDAGGSAVAGVNLQNAGVARASMQVFAGTAWRVVARNTSGVEIDSPFYVDLAVGGKLTLGGTARTTNFKNSLEMNGVVFVDSSRNATLNNISGGNIVLNTTAQEVAILRRPGATTNLLWGLDFQGQTADLTWVNYNRLQSRIVSATNGAWSGALRVINYNAGVAQITAEFAPTLVNFASGVELQMNGVVFVDASRNASFANLTTTGVTKISSTSGAYLYVDAGTGTASGVQMQYAGVTQAISRYIGPANTGTYQIVAYSGGSELDYPVNINMAAGGTISLNRNVSITGSLTASADITTSGDVYVGDNRKIQGRMATSDSWRITGIQNAADDGYLEIATADNGNESIVFRQYTGVFTSITRTLTLLDASGNTQLPGSLTCAQVTTTSNGSGQNFRVGDDLWIGDVNEPHTARLAGFSDSNQAFLKFGSSGPKLGYNGSTFSLSTGMSFFGDVAINGGLTLPPISVTATLGTLGSNKAQIPSNAATVILARGSSTQYRNYTVAALAPGQIQYVQCGVYGAPENPVAIYAASGQAVYNGIGESLATSSTPYFAIGILMLQGAANGSVYILNRGDLSL